MFPQFSKKLSRWLRLNFFDIVATLLIIGLVVWVCGRNYTPGTYLTGWDNLHPEMNIWLNIRRSLSAVWQEYQGVGLLGGMAHAADLPRQIALLVLSLVVPQSFLRYLWTFLMLALGPLGVYFFVKLAAKEKGIAMWAGLAAASFYLFNLVTVQTFFVPLETFSTFYGVIPWLFCLATRYLQEGKKRTLLVFAIVLLLSASAFYVQTLFVVFVVFLGMFMLETVVRKKVSGVKRSLRLGLVSFAVSAFWLVPVIYFTLTNGGVPVMSHINSIATPETQLMNQAAGDWQNIVQLKGFWFNYYDFFSSGKFDYLYQSWIPWVAQQRVWQIALALFVVSGLGVVGRLLNLKNNFAPSLAILFLVSYFMLASTNSIFGGAYSYIFSKVPLFSEIFRNSFTKWSMVFSFLIACGLGYFVGLFSLLKGKIKYVFVVTLSLVICTLSIYQVYPVFEGKLISERVRIKIPNEYFQLFDFFNNQTDGGRVFHLPFYNFWGWEYYKWGYGGSGFLWYGIKNPILDRAFDVWSPYNETFYNEASTTLNKYQESTKEVVTTEFENILSKYQVKYLLLDESVINAGGDEKLLFVAQIKDLISNSQNFKEVAKFGFLTVFEYQAVSVQDFVFAPSEYVTANTSPTYTKYDPVYQKYGDYISGKGENTLEFPYTSLDPRGGVTFSLMGSELVFDNSPMRVRLTSPITGVISEGFSENQGYKEAHNCDLKGKGEVGKEKKDAGVWYGAYNGGISCDWFYYPELKYDQGYVLHLKGKNITGRSLKIYLQNIRTGKIDLEELLKADNPEGTIDSYYTIYPTENGDNKNVLGYTLNVETRSFGEIASENDVQVIEFIPFDIDLLTSFSVGGLKPQVITNPTEVIDVHKLGTVFYKAKLENSDNKEKGVVALSQGYDKGWLAFSFTKDKGLNFLTHTKVNGWANGWVIPEGTEQSLTLTIFYWPQLLGWGGFLLVFIVLTWTLTSRK